MRILGRLLAALGLTLGAAISLGLFLHMPLPGIPWLLAVGFVKLGYISSLGLIAGGAVAQRLANREEARSRLSAPE